MGERVRSSTIWEGSTGKEPVEVIRASDEVTLNF